MNAEARALRWGHRPDARVTPGMTPIYLTAFAPRGVCVFAGGAIFADSLSSVLARMERERRREDAVAAFVPELL